MTIRFNNSFRFACQKLERYVWICFKVICMLYILSLLLYTQCNISNNDYWDANADTQILSISNVWRRQLMCEIWARPGRLWRKSRWTHRKWALYCRVSGREIRRCHTSEPMTSTPLHHWCVCTAAARKISVQPDIVITFCDYTVNCLLLFWPRFTEKV